MTVIIESVNQSQLDRSRDDWHRGSLDTQTNQAHHDTVGIPESSLRFPQDANEGDRDEDISDDGTDDPKGREQVTDVVERAVFGGLYVLVESVSQSC